MLKKKRPSCGEGRLQLDCKNFQRSCTFLDNASSKKVCGGIQHIAMLFFSILLMLKQSSWATNQRWYQIQKIRFLGSQKTKRVISILYLIAASLVCCLLPAALLGIVRTTAVPLVCCPTRLFQHQDNTDVLPYHCCVSTAASLQLMHTLKPTDA